MSKGNGAIRAALGRLKPDDEVLTGRSDVQCARTVAGDGIQVSALIDRGRGRSYTLLVGEKHVPPENQGDAALGDGAFYNGGGVYCGPANAGGLYQPCSPTNNVISAYGTTNPGIGGANKGFGSTIVTKPNRELQYGLKLTF